MPGEPGANPTSATPPAAAAAKTPALSPINLTIKPKTADEKKKMSPEDRVKSQFDEALAGIGLAGTKINSSGGTYFVTLPDGFKDKAQLVPLLQAVGLDEESIAAITPHRQWKSWQASEAAMKRALKENWDLKDDKIAAILAEEGLKTLQYCLRMRDKDHDRDGMEGATVTRRDGALPFVISNIDPAMDPSLWFATADVFVIDPATKQPKLVYEMDKETGLPKMEYETDPKTGKLKTTYKKDPKTGELVPGQGTPISHALRKSAAEHAAAFTESGHGPYILEIPAAVMNLAAEKPARPLAPQATDAAAAPSTDLGELSKARLEAIAGHFKGHRFTITRKDDHYEIDAPRGFSVTRHLQPELGLKAEEVGAIGREDKDDRRIIKIPITTMYRVVMDPPVATPAKGVRTPG